MPTGQLERGPWLPRPTVPLGPQYEQLTDGSPGHLLPPSPTQGHGSTQQLLPTSAGQLERGPTAVPLDHPYEQPPFPGQFLLPLPTEAAPPTQLLDPTANPHIVVEIGQGVDMGSLLESTPGLLQVGVTKPLSIQGAADLLQNPTTWLSDNKVNFPSQLLCVPSFCSGFK